MNRFISALVASGALLGGLSPALAGDACKNVRFKFKNEKTHAINVISVEYFNKANGKFQSEDIRNLACPAGATCTTLGDNLRDSEGEDLTRVVFVLKNENGENRHRTPAKDIAEPKCFANRVYNDLVIGAND